MVDGLLILLRDLLRDLLRLKWNLLRNMGSDIRNLRLIRIWIRLLIVHRLTHMGLIILIQRWIHGVLILIVLITLR